MKMAKRISINQFNIQNYSPLIALSISTYQCMSKSSETEVNEEEGSEDRKQRPEQRWEKREQSFDIMVNTHFNLH